ncbi:solute carrier family 30 (zinc transporter), member 1 [Blastomyces parvus]|uniref:Solute carrier family 30 (Zinc transporter), member 1 n=1 Tax=Blastomyces parvus TaxID=2060905 RepID=A0A2B7X976_9EURO|nr:solute carrier family 30 (zinc transporter), member 1 [Blastomyces parvus]
MWMSKSNRMILLLIIDSAFFLLELSVGYSVHSLALIADSFHMLNDVLSLLVGLWAVKVANQRTSSKVYTYGWQRAETLGALVNGVFLVALCVSIFLEAIQRFVEPQVVNNPKLVCIVGCFGLLSNVFGLVLFHDHSHAHGGHSHGHGDGTAAVDTAEQGYIQEPGREALTDESGTVASVMPENVIASWSAEERRATEHNAASSPGTRRSESNLANHRRRNSRRFSASLQRPFRDSEDIQIHPAILRREIIEASRFDEPGSESDVEYPSNDTRPSERTSLLDSYDGTSYTQPNGERQTGKPPKGPKNHDLHGGHNHAKPKTHEGKKGHSHGDLNMRGVFLHVVGDALGNIGVIASALVIWLTDYSWRYYVDPGISLVITFIILASAIPLCKAASRILLQAVPADLSIDHILEDIQSLPGIISCHHLHVWQLSDTKLVCSLHIQVSHDIKGEGSDRYMELARQVRRCLHAYGIHSSTIQPEFYPDSDVDDATGGAGAMTSSPPNNGGAGPRQRSPGGSSIVDPNCLLECGVECADARQCCPGGK